MKREEFFKRLNEYRENALLIGSGDINLSYGGDKYSRIYEMFGCFKEEDGKWVVYQNENCSSNIKWRRFFSEEDDAIDFIVSKIMCGTVCFEEDYMIYEYKYKYFSLINIGRKKFYIYRTGLAFTMDKEHSELTGNKKKIYIPKDYKQRFLEKYNKVRKS